MGGDSFDAEGPIGPVAEDRAVGEQPVVDAIGPGTAAVLPGVGR